MSEAEHLRQRQKEMRALEHRFFALSSSRLFSRIASGFKSCKDTPFDERSYRSNDAFYARYPIVTSSTNSLRRCAPEAKLFDCLIIDEASQVSLPAAALCLAHAANAVIVPRGTQAATNTKTKSSAMSCLNVFTCCPPYSSGYKKCPPMGYHPRACRERD